MNEPIFFPAGKTSGIPARKILANWRWRSSTWIVSDWSVSCEHFPALVKTNHTELHTSLHIILLLIIEVFFSSSPMMGMAPSCTTDLNPTHPFSCIPSSSSSSSKWPKGSDDNDTMLFRITRLSLLDVRRSWSWKWLYRTLHTLKSIAHHSSI